MGMKKRATPTKRGKLTADAKALRTKRKKARRKEAVANRVQGTTPRGKGKAGPKAKKAVRTKPAAAKMKKTPVAMTTVTDWDTVPVGRDARDRRDRRGRRGRRGRTAAPLDLNKKELAVVTDMLERWKASTPLSDLSRELSETEGVRASVYGNPKKARSWMYATWTRMVGGNQVMKELRASGAGARAVFGGHRAAPRQKGEQMVPRMDDSKVPRVDDTSIRAGWKWERYNAPHRIEMVYVAPDGRRYVNAKSTERADLIRTFSEPGMTDSRMRLYETSNRVKKIRKEEKLVAKGQKVRKAKLAARKKKRAATAGKK